MKYDNEDLIQAKFQIDSTINKLQKTLNTLEGKGEPQRYKSQITLAKRRIQAFEIASQLIDKEIKSL